MAEEKKDATVEQAEEPKKEESKAVEANEKVEAKEQEAAENKEEKAEAKAEKKAEEKTEKKAAKKADKKAKKQTVEVPAFLRDLNYFTDVRTDLPEINIGDVIRISYRVIEGGKERIQIFEGTVIAGKNAGITKTITVRKTSFGIAVERIFPLNSKLVQGIAVKKHQKVRRAKLYYLRNLRGKAARLKELRK